MFLPIGFRIIVRGKVEYKITHRLKLADMQILFRCVSNRFREKRVNTIAFVDLASLEDRKMQITLHLRYE